MMSNSARSYVVDMAEGQRRQVTRSDFDTQKEPEMLIVGVHNLGEVTIFRCAGRIAFGYADTLLNVISKWPCSRIAVLDLAEVTEIDAAGIGVLVSVRKLARTSGVVLKLMNLTPSVEDLLELMHLRTAFDICTVPEMLGLLCRAFEQSRFVGIDAALDTSVGGRGHSETILAETT